MVGEEEDGGEGHQSEPEEHLFEAVGEGEADVDAEDGECEGEGGEKSHGGFGEQGGSSRGAEGGEVGDAVVRGTAVGGEQEHQEHDDAALDHLRIGK